MQVEIQKLDSKIEDVNYNASMDNIMLEKQMEKIIESKLKLMLKKNATTAASSATSSTIRNNTVVNTTPNNIRKTTPISSISAAKTNTSISSISAAKTNTPISSISNTNKEIRKSVENRNNRENNDNRTPRNVISNIFISREEKPKENRDTLINTVIKRNPIISNKELISAAGNIETIKNNNTNNNTNKNSSINRSNIFTNNRFDAIKPEEKNEEIIITPNKRGKTQILGFWDEEDI